MRTRALTPLLVLALVLPVAGASAQQSSTIYPGLGSTAYDVQHYDLDLKWAAGTDSLDTGTRATITLRARTAIATFSLDLDRVLAVSHVRVDGVLAAKSRQGDKLVVDPAADLPAGSVHVVQVDYTGKPRSIEDPDGGTEGWLPTMGGGSIVLGEPRGSMTWFPNNNTPADKATFTISVDVPSGVQAVSNGRNTAVTPDGVWHWTVPEPMATYLATVAIGRYVRTTRAVDGIRYDSFVAEGQPSNTRALRMLPRVVRVLSDLFGPYPFADAGLIVDNPGVFYALELQNRPFYPSIASPSLVVHEMAHQWFGNSVTPRRWNDIWLNEGFATYAEWLWKARNGGPSTATTFRRVFANTTSWSPAPGKVTAKTLFDNVVYDRGAMTLQALRERIGTKAFFRVLRRWAADNKWGNVTTYAFKRLAEKVSGKQLDTLFRDWLYRERKPRGYV
ncbi:MAG TPA: M1 family metallopeptidase [Nocardioidaceae bacterium]|nr:M1 family metallopeptidase [Nocardioidaceae bacterium]